MGLERARVFLWGETGGGVESAPPKYLSRLPSSGRAPLFPPRAPSHARLSGPTRVGEARARLRSCHPPPRPPPSAREGWRAQAREAQRARGRPRGLHDGGASGRRRRRRRLLLPPAGLRRGPRPDGAALVSAPAPGPGPAAKGGGGGGGSPGPAAGPEPLSLPGILHFIQHEWARFEGRRPARGRARRAAGEHRPGTPGPRLPGPARHLPPPPPPSWSNGRRDGRGAAGTATGREPEWEGPAEGRPAAREGGPRGRREEAARGPPGPLEVGASRPAERFLGEGPRSPEALPGELPRSVGRG